MSSPEKEVLKSKKCCACNKEKIIDDFYKNRNAPNGYQARCKTCMEADILCRERKSYVRSKNLRTGRPVSLAPQLYNVRKEDWIETYDFLKRIGYNLSGDKTIHEQFCEKHNLEPRKRMYEKSIQYTPKDLGLS